MDFIWEGKVLDENNTNEVPQEEAHDESQINFDNMRSFIVIGTNNDGSPVRALSPTMSFDDLAAYIAQLQVVLQIEITKAAVAQYRQMQRSRPNIVRPGGM